MFAPLSSLASVARRPALLVAVLALTVCSGCMYNNHRNMGMTEKFEDSNIDVVTKIFGTPFVALGDSLISPVTAYTDRRRDAQQGMADPDHYYLSYAGSRRIASSDMGLGYQWMAGLLSIAIETVYLPITAIIDGVSVLASDKTSSGY